MQKRFQFYSAEGIKWSKWFTISDDAPKEKAQLAKRRKVKLFNEYK